LVRPRRPWLGRAALAACVVAVTLIVGGVFLSRGVRGDVATSSRPVIQADAAARWSRHTRAGRELVVLERGELRIRTQQVPGEPPFAVMLPDGELEDIGTVFSVAVMNGRTERVRVDEGSVLLKLRGRAPIMLHAGRSWQAPPPIPAPAPPLAPTPPPAASPTAEVAPSRASTPARTPRVAPPSTATAPTASAAPSDAASEDFRAALAAFNVRQLDAAARRFQRFGEQYPSDPRAEDAAYLRVLALERSGDVAGRQAAARAYLRRYPAGFRRAEVERLTR